MKLSISIMMHPSRMHHLEYLKSKLGDDIKVAIDDDNNIWSTCKKAWQLHDPSADYHVVIQDDAIIGNNFLQEAISYLRRDAIYSFYLGKKRLANEVEKARTSYSGMFITDTIHHEIALCMQTHRIQEMIDYCDKRNATTDKLIDAYAKKNGLNIVYPLPSLIDHRDEKSLHTLNKRIGPAKAIWFIGE